MSCAPDAILCQEINKERMYLKYAKRATSHEERILKTRKSGTVKECVKERKKG